MHKFGPHALQVTTCNSATGNFLLGISRWLRMKRMEVFVEQRCFELPDLRRPRVFVQRRRLNARSG
jgi:hypothetical protein